MPKTKRLPSLAAVVLVAMSYLSCRSDEAAKVVPGPSSSPAGSSSESLEPSPTALEDDDRAVRDARKVSANELGAIPILMYHRITAEPGPFDRTPEAFRRELLRLYRKGYRPVRLVDVVTGTLDVQAGMTPVVLTFDDSSPSQFSYTRKREVSPTSAFGILLNVARKNEGFDPVASFYINERPFGMTDWLGALRDLHARGSELGNHTSSHANLASLGASEVRRELALGSRLVRRATGRGARTLALPLGIRPSPRHLMTRGEWKGLRYRHLGAVLVGAGPAPSPFSRRFDPWAIPRIRSGSQPERAAPNYSSEFWLDHLDRHPGQRFISDGDPRTIAFPRGAATDLRIDLRDRALRY